MLHRPRRVAPDVNRFIKQLGPFSRGGASRRCESLGDAADVGRQALRRERADHRATSGSFAVDGQAAGGATSRRCSTSLRDTGGIERLMDYIFYQVAAINGFDAARPLPARRR